MVKKSITLVWNGTVRGGNALKSDASKTSNARTMLKTANGLWNAVIVKTVDDQNATIENDPGVAIVLVATVSVPGIVRVVSIVKGPPGTGNGQRHVTVDAVAVLQVRHRLPQGHPRQEAHLDRPPAVLRHAAPVHALGHPPVVIDEIVDSVLSGSGVLWVSSPTKPPRIAITGSCSSLCTHVIIVVRLTFSKRPGKAH